MTHMKTKLLIGGVILIAAVGYLSYAGVQKGWVYYLNVDQYMSDSQYQAKRVRLMGRVADENVDARPGELRASFVIHGVTEKVPVEYRGAVPDLFKPGCEVVIEGKLDPNGVFKADLMMTKCASKYQSEEHQQAMEATKS